MNPLLNAGVTEIRLVCVRSINKLEILFIKYKGYEEGVAYFISLLYIA